MAKVRRQSTFGLRGWQSVFVIPVDRGGVGGSSWFSFKIGCLLILADINSGVAGTAAENPDSDGSARARNGLFCFVNYYTVNSFIRLGGKI